MGLQDQCVIRSCGTTVIERPSQVLRLRKPANLEKGKVNITPPSSPTSLSSFSSKPIGHNGYYDNPTASPRLSSSGGEGAFKFLDSRKYEDTEVFTITNGSPLKTNSLSNKSTKSEVSQTFGKDSSFSEDKYKWSDSDTTDGANTHRKTKTRKICLMLLVIVLVLGILAGLAVILTFTVFKDAGKGTPVTSTEPMVSVRLEGDLDLEETWTADLNDSSTVLYKETERNFTQEMDYLMQQSNLSDSYLSTEVLGFSPGSIKVRFRMAFSDNYKLKVDSDQKLAERVEQEIKDSAEKTQLRIARQTVQVGSVVMTTPSTSTVSIDPSSVSSVSLDILKTTETVPMATPLLSSGLDILELSSTSHSDTTQSSVPLPNFSGSKSKTTFATTSVRVTSPLLQPDVSSDDPFLISISPSIAFTSSFPAHLLESSSSSIISLSLPSESISVLTDEILFPSSAPFISSSETLMSSSFVTASLSSTKSVTSPAHLLSSSPPTVPFSPSESLESLTPWKSSSLATATLSSTPSPFLKPKILSSPPTPVAFLPPNSFAPSTPRAFFLSQSLTSSTAIVALSPSQSFASPLLQISTSYSKNLTSLSSQLQPLAVSSQTLEWESPTTAQMLSLMSISQSQFLASDSATISMSPLLQSSALQSLPLILPSTTTITSSEYARPLPSLVSSLSSQEAFPFSLSSSVSLLSPITPVDKIYMRSMLRKSSSAVISSPTVPSMLEASSLFLNTMTSMSTFSSSSTLVNSILSSILPIPVLAETPVQLKTSAILPSTSSGLYSQFSASVSESVVLKSNSKLSTVSNSSSLASATQVESLYYNEYFSKNILAKTSIEESAMSSVILVNELQTVLPIDLFSSKLSTTVYSSTTTTVATTVTPVVTITDPSRIPTSSIPVLTTTTTNTTVLTTSKTPSSASSSSTTFKPNITTSGAPTSPTTTVVSNTTSILSTMSTVSMTTTPRTESTRASTSGTTTHIITTTTDIKSPSTAATTTEATTRTTKPFTTTITSTIVTTTAIPATPSTTRAPTTTTAGTTRPSTITVPTTTSTTTSSTITVPTTTSSTTSSTTTVPTSTTTPSTTTVPTTTSSTTSTTTTVPTTTSSTTTSTTMVPTTTTTTLATTKSSTTEADQPPKADAGPDVYINLPTTSVTLDSSASSDDRGIVEYRWTQTTSLPVTMEGSDSIELKLSNLQEGNYVFRLTVRDELHQSSSDTVVVYVFPELCTEVTTDTCRNLGFLSAQLPNIFGQDNMTQAVQVFNQKASSILNQICQNVALTYLCSLYFPKCNETTEGVIWPCQSLCDDAVSSCSEYFVNPVECFNWPNEGCISPPSLPTTTTTEAPSCEVTLETTCRALGFNFTIFPNLFEESDQESAIDTYAAYFVPTIEGGCHEDVGYFLCAIQFPLCVDGQKYKPCRRLCNEVVAACEDISYYFDCNTFPDIDCVAPVEPMAECQQNEFTCGKVTKCIDADKVCNGVNDCSDWTDEMDCQCDKQYEYQCKMGMCIKSFQECDGIQQCPDNSDESHCGKCRNGQVQCLNEDKCIMREWLCDGRRECSNGWDEWHCDPCSKSNFTCQLDQSCIPMSQRCDGIEHCPQGEDEWDCVRQEGGQLELQYKRLWLPVCYDSWDDSYGNYTCEVLLGEGYFVNANAVLYNGFAFANLQADGNVPSLLGNFMMTYDCMDNQALQINCKPRGCGKRMVEVSSRYIANGEDAAHGNWPWHAALYMGNIYFCGGTLINEQFVITAAHCVEKYTGDFQTKMEVKLGANNRKVKEVTQRVVSVQAISSHSMHVWFERNDIALLQLANPVNFTEYIQPVCLPDENEPLPLHSECWTVGWGKTKWDADYADVLQQLKMTLWDTQKCNSSIAWNGEVYDTFLCAGYYSGTRSICTGDSGGPLLCLDQRRVWKLRGISSYVANFCNMTERPNIFTDVAYFHSWIAEIIECKFRCDNGKCLYSSDSICDRIDDCGDNSDEIRNCNFTASCSFDDKFLCGYNWTGWGHGFDNKKAIMIELDGQFHTQSYAPQFDSTYGSLPGYFFYGKLNGYRKALLWSPQFSVRGQTCIRFAYYQRGEIRDGLSVYMREFYQNGSYTTRQYWQSPMYMTGTDEWRTGYFDVTLGNFQIVFQTEELLKVAVDDIKAIPGMCQNVLCDAQREFRCVTQDGHDKCIPRESRCNLVIDCDNAEDERSCNTPSNSYICTFENGNICGLRQNFGDASDWWLTNGSFVRDESLQRTFEDHTLKSEQGRMFYLNAYNLQSSTAIYMSQFFYLNHSQYCLSFYYIRKAEVDFTVHVKGDMYETNHFTVLPTFYGWTLFQVNLPQVETVNVTYDIRGLNVTFYSYVVLDDITVKPGYCPYYVCPAGYTKCDTIDRCYPGRSRCDRHVDCQDESDETSCACTAGEFRCSNGRCIPENKMCDRTVQCLDGSDEQNCVSYESVTCNFEHPYLCDYQFQRYSQYTWLRYSGNTPTPVTGPQYDHTLGNSNGHYVYAEANKGAVGDNATLISPAFNTGYNNSIEFWYHLFSSSVVDTSPGVMHFILQNVNTGLRTIRWSSNLDLVDAWRRLCFDLPPGENLKALFTAVRNETTVKGVDFAVDDVKLNYHLCTEAPASTTAVPTTSTTSSYSSTGAQWYCDNGQGINADYRCDGASDCIDGSDERDCP